MSAFSKPINGNLLNRYTIAHHEHHSNSRPFLSTCVPKPIVFEIAQIEIHHGVEWQSKDYRSRAPEGHGFWSYSTISARGNTKDKITVFTMTGGQVAQFSEVEVSIRPLPTGHVGGKTKASSFDGIAYSGMSAKEVPIEGLMDGEPGSLMYVNPTSDPLPTGKAMPYINVEAYIDEPEFVSLVEKLSSSSVSPVSAARMVILAELFEYEVDAALSEPWFSKDYGLLIDENDSSYAHTRLRVESLGVSFKPREILTNATYETKNGTFSEREPKRETAVGSFLRKLTR